MYRFSLLLNDEEYIKYSNYLDLSIEKSMYNYNQCRVVLDNTAREVTALNLCYPSSSIEFIVESLEGDRKRYSWKYIVCGNNTFDNTYDVPIGRQVAVEGVQSMMQFEKVVGYVGRLEAGYNDMSIIGLTGELNSFVFGTGYEVGRSIASRLYDVLGKTYLVGVDYRDKTVRCIDLDAPVESEMVCYSTDIAIAEEDEDKAVSLIGYEVSLVMKGVTGDVYAVGRAGMQKIGTCGSDDPIDVLYGENFNKVKMLGDNKNYDWGLVGEAVECFSGFNPRIYLGMPVELKITDGGYVKSSGEYVRIESRRFDKDIWRVVEYEHKIKEDAMSTFFRVIRSNVKYHDNYYVKLKL